MDPHEGRRQVRPRILLGVTSKASLVLLQGAPEQLAASGWEVHVVCSSGTDSPERVSPHVTLHDIPMERDPSPRDLVALIRWVRLMRRIRPDVVAVGTPKAGLLGSLAGLLGRAPFRVYVLRGLRFESVNGWRRQVLLMAERVAAGCSHVVLAVSYSLRAVAVQHRVAPGTKIRVVGMGSSNGVDCSPDDVDGAAASANGTDARPGVSVLTLGFVGRGTADKGIDLLLASIEVLAESGQQGHLLVVGGVEDDESGSLLSSFSAPGWTVERTGHVADVRPYYRRMSALVLPTRREGFPNVVLEAAVHGVPCVATAATGIDDAILDGVTGWVLPTREPRHLAALLRAVAADPARTQAYGEAARSRATRLFERSAVQSQLEAFYRGGREAMATTSHLRAPESNHCPREGC